MVVFTMVDYWKYSRGFPIKNTLNETKEKYERKVHQYRDKIFRIILDDKKEFLEFLKKYEPGLGFEHLKEKDIEKYNRKFVTSGMKIKESDVIYKIVNKDVFIIVEHQSKVDNNMPVRMTQYCIEIIRSIRKNNKNRSALIFPIVLYTGKGKWTAPLTIDETQAKFYKVPPQNYPKYELLDIKNDTKEKLINENTGMSKVLLFEKLKTKEEFEVVLGKLLKKNLTKEEIKYIQIMLTYSNFIREKLSDVADEYIKELDEKGEGNMLMFEKLFVEYVESKIKMATKEGEKNGEKIGEKRGEKKGEEKGRKLAIKEIAKEMLKRKINDEKIISMTKISPKELEKIKNT